MYDYMQALHQRFCREPDRPELERALDDAYHVLRGNIARQDQELLLVRRIWRSSCGRRRPWLPSSPDFDWARGSPGRSNPTVSRTRRKSRP